MIVTKEIADQYILKRGCYLIHEQADGDYAISYETLNWKEGMEIFPTLEACNEEIERRLKARMKPGDCPKCYNKRTIVAEINTGEMQGIPGKFAHLFRCSRCLTIWYPTAEKGKYYAYDQSVADYLLDWNSRDLKPSTAQIVLDKDVSSDKSESVYLQSVTLKSGQHYPCAIVFLKDVPPAPYWFERKDLFFLDQVDELGPSPYAFSYAISKKAWKDKDFVYIKDVVNNELFRFDALVTMFCPEVLCQREFVLAGKREIETAASCKTIAERDDRGAPAYWYFQPPPQPVYIWGDKG